MPGEKGPNIRPKTIFCRLHDWDAQRKQKIEQRRAQLKAQELAECSGTPDTSKSAAKLRRGPRRSPATSSARRELALGVPTPPLSATHKQARPSLIPPDARFPRAQGSSGATTTVPFVWRGHTKSRTTRAGRALELALRLG